jgi:hypothetical protein
MHHSTNPGKRVKLKLRDGTSVVGKFIQTTTKTEIVLDVDGVRTTFAPKKIDKFIVVKTVPIHTAE